MLYQKTKFLFGLLSIPLVFRLIERVNGPWPVPFKWPEVSREFLDYDFTSRRYISPEKGESPSFVHRTIDPKEICKYSRNCLPKSVDLPKKIASAPKVGLASCIVGGILAEEIEALTCYLERSEVIGPKMAHLTPKELDNYCGATNKFHSITEMSKNIRIRIRDMKSWRFLMLTRHPVERFIHGFYKHCISKPGNCYECGNDMACFAEAYHLRLQQYVLYNEGNYKGISELDWDLFPQTWMCDVEEWREKYTLIPFSSNIFNLAWNISSSLGEKHFPAIHRILNSRRLEPIPSADLLSELRNTIESSLVLQKTLASMYHNDYEVLNFARLV